MAALQSSSSNNFFVNPAESGALTGHHLSASTGGRLHEVSSRSHAGGLHGSILRGGGLISSSPSNASQFAYLRLQASTVVGNSSVVVKFICGAIIIGYLISFSPVAVHLLTVVPGNLIPPNFWVWTVVTHSFIEVHCWMVIVDIAVVFLYGKLLEPLWGALEMLRFYAVVNLVIAALTSLTYLFIYLLTRNTNYLFNVHIHGLAGYLAGFSVAVKQSMPDHVLINSPFGKLRNKHIPLWVLLLAFLVRIIGGVDAPFPIMFGWGLVVSWVYLRFYQYHGNGNRGDMVDSFSFASFFPDMVQPVVAVLSNTFYSALISLKICKKTTSKRFETVSPVTVAISLPGTDAHDAERRRQLALKALNERLSKVPTSSWPEMDESDGGGSKGSLSPGSLSTSTTDTGGAMVQTGLDRQALTQSSANSELDSVTLDMQK